MPSAAVPVSIVRVEELPPVTDVGLKLALAPNGNLDTLRATVSGDPLVTAVEMVDDPDWPCVMLTVLGKAMIEKSFPSLTVNVSCVAWVTSPEVPVIVSVYVPGAAVPVSMVSVEEPRSVTEAGSKLADRARRLLHGPPVRARQMPSGRERCRQTWFPSSQPQRGRTRPAQRQARGPRHTTTRSRAQSTPLAPSHSLPADRPTPSISVAPARGLCCAPPATSTDRPTGNDDDRVYVLPLPKWELRPRTARS